MIDAAEDRERFQKLLRQAEAAPAAEPHRAHRPRRRSRLADEIGYPLVVRPSYVLGGRAMEIVHEQADLERYMREAVQVSNDSPVLLDRFLDDAIEVDVDCVCRRQGRVHRRRHGAHRAGGRALGRLGLLAAAVIRCHLKSQRRAAPADRAMARALNVVGLMNVQFAIQDGNVVYVLEVNPRASRTVPFVSKATGLPLAKIAARCMVGKIARRSRAIDATKCVPPYFSVKEAVFPFIKFPGVDTILGPEMKSTGEVMGVGAASAKRSSSRSSPRA